MGLRTMAPYNWTPHNWTPYNEAPHNGAPHNKAPANGAPNNVANINNNLGFREYYKETGHFFLFLHFGEEE